MDRLGFSIFQNTHSFCSFFFSFQIFDYFAFHITTMKHAAGLLSLLTFAITVTAHGGIIDYVVDGKPYNGWVGFALFIVRC